jgi:hypothetical protein
MKTLSRFAIPLLATTLTSAAVLSAQTASPATYFYSIRNENRPTETGAPLRGRPSTSSR